MFYKRGWNEFNICEATIHRAYQLLLVRQPHNVVSLRGEIRDDCDFWPFEIQSWVVNPPQVDYR